MRPPCYDRPPREKSYYANVGLSPQGHQRRAFIPIVFVDRCATWDGRGVGPNGEPYPLAHGWDCAGCKWLPESARLLTDTSTSLGAVQHDR